MSKPEIATIKPRYVDVDDHQAVLAAVAKERRAKRELGKAKASILRAQAEAVEAEAAAAEAQEERETLVRNVKVKHDIPAGHAWDDISRKISETPVE